MIRRKETPETNPSEDKKKLWVCLVVLAFLFAILGIMSVVEKHQNSQPTETSPSVVTTSITTSTTFTTTTLAEEISVVPEGAVVEEREGKWGLYKDGVLVSNFTGIATNKFGDWYLVHGLVDFGFNGTVNSGNKSQKIVNGKVEVPTTTTTKPSTTTVKYANLPSGVRDLVLRSERYATNHIDKNFTNKYKFDQTWGNIDGDDKNYTNELPPQSNHSIVNVYFNSTDGTSATFTFSSEYGGVLKLKYVYIGSSLPTASPLGNED